MQVIVNIPEMLTERVKDKWGDLSVKIVNSLVLKAFQDGLIDFKELREMLHFADEEDFKAFLRDNNMLHDSGLLNLYGSCSDIDFADNSLGISEDMIGEFNE